MSEMITPIEYANGDYANRDDVVVWCGDMIITSIHWHDESTYTRKGYNVEYRNDDYRRSQVDTYSHCLRVEPAGHEYTRQLLRDIIELIPDEDLLEHLEHLRDCVMWERLTNE